MGDWENRHLQVVPPQSGKPGGAPYWGIDFVAVVIDAHNGLQMDANRYTGLAYKPITQKTTYQAYEGRDGADIWTSIPYMFSNFWESIKPFCLGMEMGAEA